jgi:predicted ATPase
VRDPFVRSVVLKRDGVDFNRSPFSIPAIRNLSELELDPHVTLIAGENGSGRSTLKTYIEDIPEAVASHGGERQERLAVGLFVERPGRQRSLSTRIPLRKIDLVRGGAAATLRR